MSAMASQITNLTIVYSVVYSAADQRKHQSSASLAFVWGIHQWPVNSPHKGPVTRKVFPFHDVVMDILRHWKVASWQADAFRITVPLCGEFTGHWWFRCIGAKNAELWSNLCYQLEQAVEETFELSVFKTSWRLCDVTVIWPFLDSAKLPDSTFCYQSCEYMSYKKTVTCSRDQWVNPPSGPRLNIKSVLSRYGDFHVKDKTAVRTSYL